MNKEEKGGSCFFIRPEINRRRTGVVLSVVVNITFTSHSIIHSRVVRYLLIV